MNSSPDNFHHIRINNSSIKASNINLQLMEYKSHNQTVNDYKLDIIEHLLSMEHQTQPNLSLIQQQPEINLRMRPLLLDFLMDVINKLRLSKSTFPSTVNLIDRYCSIRIVKKQHYQLLGLTCLWISCKNLDSKFKIPSLNDLCKMCCNCYDKKLFLEMENHILKSLNWLIGVSTFDSFIDFYINSSHSQFLLPIKNNNKLCNDIKILSIYICELIQFYPNIYFNYNSSQIALTSFITSLLILDVKTFNLNSILTSVYNFTNEKILTIDSFQSCYNLLIKILKCPPPSLKLKYFNDDGKYINLMKILINFSNKAIATIDKIILSTPKFIPTTPTSNNISPKYSNDQDKAIKLSPYKIFTSASNNNTSVNDSTILPSPKLSPPENNNKIFYNQSILNSSNNKRSFEDLDLELNKQDQSMNLKRSKSFNSRPVFYIS